MKNSSFLNALGTLVYIAIVATLLQNAGSIFGKMANYIGPIAFLLLFTLSALVVGSLVLGRPLMMYLDGKKKEAVALLMQTIFWLAGFTVLALLLAYFLK